MYRCRSQNGTPRLHNCLCLSVASTTRRDSLRLCTPRIHFIQYVISMVRAVHIVTNCQLECYIDCGVVSPYSASETILTSLHRPFHYALPELCLLDTHAYVIIVAMSSTRKGQLLLTVNLQQAFRLRLVFTISHQAPSLFI